MWTNGVFKIQFPYQSERFLFELNTDPVLKQAQVTPLFKKPTLDTSLVENYKTYLSPPFHSKITWTHGFQPLSSFHRTTSWTVPILDLKVAIQPKPPCCQSLNHYGSTEGNIISAPRFICCFWHCQSSNPSVHTLFAEHHRNCSPPIWVLPHR